ncbi:MAG: type II toxin-antitoxin system VapC family toxin [Bdellovibrionota bacterium]
MIVPDINLLIYAYNSRQTEHQKAKEWWESVLSSNEVIGLSWIVILGFIRLTTNRKVFSNPLSVKQALKVTESWLEIESVSLINPGSKHFEILSKHLVEINVAGNLTTDVHLASLAIEFQATLYSNDSDFSRFSGLKWVNPL